MDFTEPLDSMIVFPSGSNSSSPPVCTVISIIDDSVDELKEQFEVSLAVIPGNPTQLAAPSTAVVYIPRDPDDGIYLNFFHFLTSSIGITVFISNNKGARNGCLVENSKYYCTNKHLIS